MYPGACLLRFFFHFPGLRIILCRLSRELYHFHNPLRADSRRNQSGKKPDDTAEGSPERRSHGYKHGHGPITDFSLPEAVHRESVTGISYNLSHQRSDNHGSRLKFILFQRHLYGILLQLIKLFLYLIQHTECLNKLKILKSFLVKHGTVAGQPLIFPLKISGPFYTIPGHNQ